MPFSSSSGSLLLSRFPFSLFLLSFSLNFLACSHSSTPSCLHYLPLSLSLFILLLFRLFSPPVSFLYFSLVFFYLFVISSSSPFPRFLLPSFGLHLLLLSPSLFSVHLFFFLSFLLFVYLRLFSLLPSLSIFCVHIYFHTFHVSFNAPSRVILSSCSRLFHFCSKWHRQG